MQQQIVDRVIEAISYYVIEKDRVPKEDTHFWNMFADSLDQVEALMSIEDAFHLTIPDEDAEKFSTFGQVVAYIEAVEGAKNVFG
jgi:acyl carrier protein